MFLNDLHGQFTLPDGETVEMEGKAGDAIWAEAGPHQPKNVGPAPELILAELKAPMHESHEKSTGQGTACGPGERGLPGPFLSG